MGKVLKELQFSIHMIGRGGGGGGRSGGEVGCDGGRLAVMVESWLKFHEGSSKNVKIRSPSKVVQQIPTSISSASSLDA